MRLTVVELPVEAWCDRRIPALWVARKARLPCDMPDLDLVDHPWERVVLCIDKRSLVSGVRSSIDSPAVNMGNRAIFASW